jgi:biopolymer transport protein ExbB/TolQ
MSGLLTLFAGPYAWALRLGLYAALCAAIAGAGAWQMHKWDAGRYDALQADYATFKAATAAAGQAAQQRAQAQEKSNQQAKDKADENHTNAVAGLNAQLERLRRAAAAGSTVPAAPAAARSPQLACFDRALLGDAVDGFVGDVSRQVASGAAATVDLDNVKSWAQGAK